MRSSAGRSRAGSPGSRAGGADAGATRPGARGGSRSPAAAGGSATQRVRTGLLSGLAAAERFGRGEFPSSLYLDGPSEAVKTAVLAELRLAWRRHCPEAPLARVFRAAESGVEEILAAYQGGSLFCPRELSIVLDVEDLGRSEKKVLALAAGIASSAGASCMAFVESASDVIRKSLEPLRAACASRIEALPPGRAELLRWGALRLERDGVSAEPGALEAVVDASEGDALAFFSELDKLQAATPAGTLRKKEVTALLAPVVGADLPDYLAAVALGQGGIATQKLGRLLAAGVGEGAILFGLANLVGGALGGWARHRDLSATLRRRVHPRALARALDAVYRAEAAWKSGRADVVAVLEQATREVSAV